MYNQVDGVTMGSALAPNLANIFMGFHEKGWIRNYNYKRYVDDISAVFETKDHTASFYSYINKQHSNIKFTMKTEKNGKLPLLDVLVYSKPNLVTSIYRKPTYTGLLTVLHHLSIKLILLKLCWIGVTKSTSHGKVVITISKIRQKV